MRYMSTHSLQERIAARTRATEKSHDRTYVPRVRTYLNAIVLPDGRLSREFESAIIIAEIERGKHVIATVCNSTNRRP